MIVSREGEGEQGEWARVYYTSFLCEGKLYKIWNVWNDHIMVGTSNPRIIVKGTTVWEGVGGEDNHSKYWLTCFLPESAPLYEPVAQGVVSPTIPDQILLPFPLDVALPLANFITNVKTYIIDDKT